MTRPITDLGTLRAAWALDRTEEEQRSDAQWRALWHRYFDRSQLPSGPVVLYRGATRETRRGMSWTMSRTDAAWYAEAWGPQGRVWRTTVPPEAILGTVDREFVVDARRLGKIDDVTHAAPPSDRAQRSRERRRFEQAYREGMRSRRGNGRPAIVNAIAAQREAGRRGPRLRR